MENCKKCGRFLSNDKNHLCKDNSNFKVWNKGLIGYKNPKHSETLKRLFKEGKLIPWLKGKRVDRIKYPIMGHFQNLSEKSRKKISQKLKGRKVWNKGKTLSEKNRIKLKEVHNSLATKQKHRIARLNQVFSNRDTSPEIILQTKLIENNIEFKKHKNIENFVQCDIFIEPNIVIFVDGCYWHGCPTHFPDRTKLDGIQNKDIIRDVLVNQFFNNLNGKYIVLRFWEHEIKEDSDNAVNRILNSLLIEEIGGMGDQ